MFFFNYKIMNAFFIPLNGGFNFAKIRGFKVTDYRLSSLERRKRAIIKDIGFSRYLACGGLS